MTRRAEARDDVQRKAYVVAVDDRRFARVQRHADAQTCARGPVVCPQRALRFCRRDKRARGGFEHTEERVATGPELHTAVRDDRLADEGSVGFELRAVPVAELVQETGRTFEVSEQERERPRRELASVQPAGSQNSSWMLSGSRNTITDPIAVSAIGVKSIPCLVSSPSQASSSARLETPNAKWSSPVRSSSN